MDFIDPCHLGCFLGGFLSIKNRPRSPNEYKPDSEMVGFDAFSFFRNGDLKKTGGPGHSFTPPKFNIFAPEKITIGRQAFPFGRAHFQGRTVKLQDCNVLGDVFPLSRRKPSKETLPKSCSKNWWIPEGRRAAFKQ